MLAIIELRLEMQVKPVGSTLGDFTVDHNVNFIDLRKIHDRVGDQEPRLALQYSIFTQNTIEDVLSDVLVINPRLLSIV